MTASRDFNNPLRVRCVEIVNASPTPLSTAEVYAEVAKEFPLVGLPDVYDELEAHFGSRR